MEYQEIWENLTADKGNIVELYAEFEKQSKSVPPTSTLRTSFLKEFGTRATTKGLGGWAGLKVLVKAPDVVNKFAEIDMRFNDSFQELAKAIDEKEKRAAKAGESMDNLSLEVSNVAPVKRVKKKLKKKIKKRAPKPVVETTVEENTPGEIQQESFQEILSESETESGGALFGIDSVVVGDDLDLSDVLGVEEEPEQELF